MFPDGSVLGAQEVIERDRLADPKALARARTGTALLVSAPGGKVVYEPVQRSNGTLAVIRVFVPNSKLTENVVQRWAFLGAVGAALVAFAVALSDRIARSLVRSVAGLATTANRLGRGDVEARNEPTGPPEVQEVGRSLNALAERIDELLGTERAAAADLQHRLRTPVTALRAEVSALQNDSNRHRLELTLEDLTTTIDTIIREAAQPTRRGLGVRSDLALVARQRVAFWQVLADDQRRVLSMAIEASPCPVAIVASDVGAIVDALLDNVFSHTPEGTAFTVGVRILDGSSFGVGNTGGPAENQSRVLLEVTDDGPGFGASPIVRGSSGSGSTGLGLDIVRKLVEGAAGSFSIDHSPGKTGAHLRVLLPLLVQTTA